MTADAKALQYILRTTTYQFQKGPEMVIAATAMSGLGIISANGSKSTCRARDYVG